MLMGSPIFQAGFEFTIKLKLAFISWSSCFFFSLHIGRIIHMCLHTRLQRLRSLRDSYCIFLRADF